MKFELKTDSNLIYRDDIKTFNGLGFEFKLYSNDWFVPNYSSVELENFSELFRFLKEHDAILVIDSKNENPYIEINHWH